LYRTFIILAGFILAAHAFIPHQHRHDCSSVQESYITSHQEQTKESATTHSHDNEKRHGKHLILDQFVVIRKDFHKAFKDFYSTGNFSLCPYWLRTLSDLSSIDNLPAYKVKIYLLRDFDILTIYPVLSHSLRGPPLT